MPKPKIVGVYKVKNESRFIEQSLKSVMDICSDIVVLDNNSSDDTVKVLYSLEEKMNIQNWAVIMMSLLIAEQKLKCVGY